jgi:hypothetical protein
LHTRGRMHTAATGVSSDGQAAVERGKDLL